MEIKYLGHASFLIKSKTARLITDPFDPAMVGFRFPKTEADIVTISHHHHDHDNSKAIEGNPLIIDMPGEFEKNGIRVFGYKGYHDKKKGQERGEVTLYKFEADEISLLHCGDLGEIPQQSAIDEIGKVDILFVPVGGIATINSNEAVELIKEFEPSIVIPMHYNSTRHNQKVFAQFAPISDFLKKVGAENTVPIQKLIVKKEDLTDEMKVVVFGT